MNFVCEKETILKAINSVINGVASKTTMPILEGILIQTNENEVKLTSYDLEIGIEYIMESKVEEQGNTVVNATMFSEIIRKLPNKEIRISINSNNLLEIECEGSLYKLATMNPDEFPELPKINIENSVEIEQTVLKNMIRKTIFAVSTEENRPIFTGCLFEIADGKLNVVAVDGYRLAVKSAKLNDNSNNFSSVIPGKTLNEVNKIMADSFDTVKIGISRNQALFEMENCKIVTRLLDGEFLKYQNAIPANWETRIKVNKSEIQDCFERIILISASSIEKEKKYPVKISIEVGKVVISCANQTGDAKEEIFPETEGKELEIGEEGEICVHGPTLMSGYLNNPKETKNMLRKHKDKKIWLHTGDIGYIASNGIIYYTQRLKRMIIVSGFNVYPSMIEKVLETHPAVKKACVIGIPHPYKMHVPKAYLLLNEGYSDNGKLKRELKDMCKETLSVFSVPKEFEVRKEFPKTLYSKIDYKQLEKEELEKRKN